MTNLEIKEKILSLRQKKRSIIQQMKTFELNKDLMQIAQEIKELQQTCTHVDEDGNKKISQHGCCFYCGKREVDKK